MKKLFLLFFCGIFLFSKNTFAQSTRISEIVSEEKDSFDFHITSRSIFHYNHRGDTSYIEHLNYDKNGNIFSWTGDFYEYDNQNRLSKMLLKRYNPDVDLWISIYWIEYFYDKNGCIEQFTQIVNAGGLTEIYYDLVDERCRAIERINETSTTKILFEYPDEYGSDIKTYYRSNNNILTKDNIVATIFNDKKDMIKNTYVSFDVNEIDTSIFFIVENEYTYSYNSSSGKLESKMRDMYRNLFPYDSYTPVFSRSTHYDYSYYCDGLLHQVVTTDHIGNSQIETTKRKTYFYEGKNKCFDYDQNLDVEIFPNPTNGFVNLKSKIFESGDTQVQVFTMDGKFIMEQGFYSRSFSEVMDLSQLKNGIYFLKIQSDKYFSTEKLILAK